MPYRNDQDARAARRAARVRSEKERVPVAFRISRGSVVAVALGVLPIVALAVALVRPPARASRPVEDRPMAHAAHTTEHDDAPTRSLDGQLGGLAGLAGLGNDSNGAPGLAGMLGGSSTGGLHDGVHTARAAVDTLFHLAEGTLCEVELRTEGTHCEAEVRCGGRTLYASDAASGLTCVRGLGGVSTLFDRATTSTDGSPALFLTNEEVQIVDNAPGATGITRLALGSAPRASVL